MNIGSLFAKIGFQVDEGPLERLGKSIDSLKERINSVGESVNQVKHIMELTLGVELMKKLYETSEHFAEWGQHLKVTADTLGTTTEEIQKLSYAAGQSGVSADEMTHSLAHLARHIYEAKMGSKEAADAFFKAGIGFSQVQGFTTAQDALSALADRVSQVKEPMQRLGMVQALLGRGGYQMVSFLSKGSQAFKDQGDAAEKLGLIISGPQINNLYAMALGFQRLKMFVQEVGAYIASYFGPAIIKIIDRVIAFYNANKKLIDLELKAWLDRIAYSMGVLAGLAIRAAQWTLYLIRTVHDLWASLNQTPAWGRGLPPWAQAIKEFFESFGVGKTGIRISDLFKGENASKLSEILDAILTKAHDKIKGLFRNILGTQADETIMAGLGKTIGELLNAALIASGFAYSLGGAIADGMIEAFIEKFRQEFPVAGAFLFGEPKPEGPEGPATSRNVGLSAFSPTGKYSFSNVIQGLAGGQPAAAGGGLVGPPASYSNAIINKTYNFHTPITVPSGTDVKAAAEMLHREMQKKIDDQDRADRQRASQDQQAQASETR